MGKVKKNHRQNADALTNKKAAVKPKKLNPFEIHLNKEKFKILGRKCKHDRGLPGVSRAKAQKKRKVTLGREYLEKHKTNQFKDHRIGRGATENDADEDLATARFTAEKVQQYREKKKNLFNLNDDEMLTHRGQTLEEIEQFREPDSDGSDDEALNANFTEVAHFGGDEESDKIDRKAAIEEMIAETKRKKAEIAKDKDEVYELTTRLDSSYKSLIPLMGKLSKNERIEKPPPDDYDRALREMIFEPRGAVSDKLESEEVLLKKEKDRLEKLEQERQARMRGEYVAVEAKPTHRSADALDDGYFVESDNEEEPMLAYNMDGNLNLPIDATRAKDDDDALGDDTLENGDDEDLDANNEEGEDEDSGEEEESDEDSLDDLKVSESESEADSCGSEGEEIAKKVETELEKKNASKRKAEEIESRELKRQKAEKQLPFTYEMPASYEDLFDMLEKQNPENQGSIVDRIIKCNHPKLDATNKEKMLTLLTYLLQYVNDLFGETTPANVTQSFLKFDKLLPHIYDLVRINPDRGAPCIREVIKEKYDEYKKNPKNFPPLETVIIFKLVSNVFSTSDFRHPIVTPCFVFISHILSRSRIRSRKDLAIGLFLVSIVSEFTTLSKRFLPAAVNFLLGTIFLAVRKRPIEIIRIIPPFQSTGPNSGLLVLEDKFGGKIDDLRMQAIDLVKTQFDAEFKVRALNSALKMLADFVANTNENVALRFMLDPFPNILDRIDFELYPKTVQDSSRTAQQAITSVSEKPLKRLVEIAKKPKALRLMEPKIVPVYDDKRRPTLSKEKEMRAILTHKIKRETKGAVREIRRDNAFIAKIQIKKQIESDMERKEKVRQIYAEASIQQGELNALSRSKKKNKF